jgi:hypothetical protein
VGGGILRRLGLVRSAQGWPEAAVACLEQSLILVRASGERLELRRFDQAELAVLLAGVLARPPEPRLLWRFRPLGGRPSLRWLEMDAPIDYALASGWQANTT